MNAAEGSNIAICNVYLQVLSLGSYHNSITHFLHTYGYYINTGCGCYTCDKATLLINFYIAR